MPFVNVASTINNADTNKFKYEVKTDSLTVDDLFFSSVAWPFLVPEQVRFQ